MTNERAVWIAVVCTVAVLCVLLVGFGIITVLAAHLHDAARSANETAAQASIRTIHQAQVQYNSLYNRFASSVTELGPPVNGTSSAAAADLIGSDLAIGEKNGYKFAMTGNESGYQITAVPVAFGATGSRTFYSDQTMVIRQNDGPEPATVNSQEVGLR
ncbi:MAG TPA: hypothetical protein VKF41_08695 [Bryobacteraceae bacterium]|nr:hypothetical protein [Bryobacteraceae bacterium]